MGRSKLFPSRKLLSSVLIITIFISVFFVVHCEAAAAAAATTKAPTPAPTTTVAPIKCPKSSGREYRNPDSAEISWNIQLKSPTPQLSSVCIEFDYYFAGAPAVPVDVLGSLELSYTLTKSGNHPISLTTLQLNTWRPLSDALLCLANYVSTGVTDKDYNISLKLRSPKYSNLCFSSSVIYQNQVKEQHAIDFLLPFGDASNASTADSALNELESLVPEETVDELWHSQWNDAFLQFDDYFEFTSRSIRFSSSMNISSASAAAAASGSSATMTARLSTKWIHLTDSLKPNKKKKNNPIYLYRLSNGQLNGHHLKVHPVVCTDRGFCFEVDLDDQKTDLVSADVHFSLPSRLFEEGSTTEAKLFRLEFVFEFSFQREDATAAHSTSISVELALLDAAHPCYYFNSKQNLITDRPNRCTHQGICVASREVAHLNWRCFCPTDHWGPRCEVSNYCSQRIYRLPETGENGGNLTGKEVCKARGPRAGTCVNREFTFACNCGGDSDYSWRPVAMQCLLRPLCPKNRDACNPVTQVCEEPAADGSEGKKVKCRCAPGYEPGTEDKNICQKPNACSPNPCGLNAECLPVLNSMDDFKTTKNKPFICFCKKGYVKDDKNNKEGGKLNCKKPDFCAVGGQLAPPCQQICNSTSSDDGNPCSCHSGYERDPQHSERCLINPSVKLLCPNGCPAVGSWCDENTKSCKCKNGFNISSIAATNSTKAVYFCKVDSKKILDFEACPNGKLVNNKTTGALECACDPKEVFVLDRKRRVCQLRPICSAGGPGYIDCTLEKSALCLLTDKANQIQAATKGSSPKIPTNLTMSDLYTCSCKPGQHWEAQAINGTTTHKCVDLCADETINKECNRHNAVCNPLAALGIPANANATLNKDKLYWRSFCLCKEGLFLNSTSDNCTLPKISDPLSSYTVQLNFSKESYQLLFQFKNATNQELHAVPLSNGDFLNHARDQFPADNFKQLVKDYRSSVDAAEAAIKKQVDGSLGLLMGQRFLDIALSRMVEQYMGQLVAHSPVIITTRNCKNSAEEGFVDCTVEIVVKNETQAAPHIDEGDLVTFFHKQFTEYCVDDDDDGDVCTIAIAGQSGLKKEDASNFFWADFEAEDGMDEDEDVSSANDANFAKSVTEPISLKLSKKSVEHAAFEQFDACKNSQCPNLTECKRAGSSYECNCKYGKGFNSKGFNVYETDKTATSSNGFGAPIHRCIPKSPNVICAHYADKYAEEHKTNRSYFDFDNSCLDLNETSPTGPLATVHFNCSNGGWSVRTNASSDELQDGFVHVTNYCVNKWTFFCSTHDCNGAHGQCEVKQDKPSCRCQDGWLGDRCQTKESLWYMIGLIIAGSLMLLVLIANTAWCILHKRKKRARSRPRHSNSLYLNRVGGDSTKGGGHPSRHLENIEMSHYEMNGTYRRHESPSLPPNAAASSSSEHLPPRFTIVSTTTEQRGGHRSHSRGADRGRRITEEVEEEEEMEYNQQQKRDRHHSRSRRAAEKKAEALRVTKSAPSSSSKAAAPTAPKKAPGKGTKSTSIVSPPYTISSRQISTSTSSSSSSSDSSSSMEDASSMDLPPSRPPSVPPSPPTTTTTTDQQQQQVVVTISTAAQAREPAHSASSSSSAGGATATSSSSDKPVILTRSMLLGQQSSGSSIGGGGTYLPGKPSTSSAPTKQTSFQYVPSNLRNRSNDPVEMSGGGGGRGDPPRASGRASKSTAVAMMTTNPAVSALQNATKELGSKKATSSSSSSRTRNNYY